MNQGVQGVLDKENNVLLKGQNKNALVNIPGHSFCFLAKPATFIIH